MPKKKRLHLLLLSTLGISTASLLAADEPKDTSPSSNSEISEYKTPADSWPTLDPSHRKTKRPFKATPCEKPCLPPVETHPSLETCPEKTPECKPCEPPCPPKQETSSCEKPCPPPPCSPPCLPPVETHPSLETCPELKPECKPCEPPCPPKQEAPPCEKPCAKEPEPKPTPCETPCEPPIETICPQPCPPPPCGPCLPPVETHPSLETCPPPEDECCRPCVPCEPPAEEDPCAPIENKVFIRCLKGIYLACDNAEKIIPVHVRSKDTGINQQGLCLSQVQFAKLQNKLSYYLGYPLNPKGMEEIKRTIISFYRSQGYPIVAVQVPEQDVTDGVLVIGVCEARLGKVEIQGARWFKQSLYCNYLHLNPGQPISSDKLVMDLAFMNLNPFRNVNAIFAPGDKYGTTDVELLVQEKFPFKVYLGTDNTGLRETGYERIFAGFNWGNVFGLDHLLSYQFTANPDFRKFMSHTASYTAPLPWRHILMVFGAYSNVHIHMREGFKNKGWMLQVSGRYQVPLRPGMDFLHQVNAGIDFKRQNNFIDFGGTIVSTKLVNIFQFLAGYNFTYHPPTYKTFFEIEAVGSPGQLVDDMSKKRFDILRPVQIQRTFTAKPICSIAINYQKEWPLKRVSAAS